MWPWLLIQLASGPAIIAPPEPSVQGGGFGHAHARFSQRPQPPDVHLTVDLALYGLEFSASVRVVPADVPLRTRLLLAPPALSADLEMTPADMRLRALMDLEAMTLSARVTALARKKDA